MMSETPSGSVTTNAVNQLYNAEFEKIRERYFSTGEAEPALSVRTSVVDSIVETAFRDILTPAWPTGLAALAVGGYGRKELFPHSDIDLLLLMEDPPESKERKEALSQFLKTIWDAGLRLSHSVRSIAECTELNPQNHELNISILDQRFLAGDSALYSRLTAKLPKFWASERQSLIRHIGAATRTRHDKFHDTVYHLEPHVKEGPGGLRDLHVIGWLHKLRDPQKHHFDYLPELVEAQEFLHKLRCFLHFSAGRDQNQLTFDAQEEYVDQSFIHAPTVASWMRQYFLHSRKIHRLVLQVLDICETPASGLLSQFREWRSRLSNSEMSVSRDRILLRSPQQLETDPELAMRLIRFVARHGIALAADTEKRLKEALPAIETHFAEPRQLWNYLQEIFALPHAMTALRAMHETGLFAALIPEWRLIDGMVMRDFYHRYTVDEHTLITIENLLQLRKPQQGTRQHFAELFEEIESPPLLIFALILHDVGKGAQGESHSLEGVRLGRVILDRIGMPVEQQTLVLFLVERHLELSSVMNSRDLSDPTTAVHLADRVGTIEQLRYLTLLTYSDISGVNPSAMTPWRLDQLWRVYIIGYRELTRELDTDRITAPQGVSLHAAAFLEGLPVRYLRTHNAEQIEDHARLATQSADIGVGVDIKKESGVWRLSLITRDRPRLFSAIAGTLSAFGLNIVKAEAFSNKRGEIVDAFTFSDPTRNLELNPSETDRLKLMLERVALGKADVRTLLAGRRKADPPSRRERLRPSVEFDNEASHHATLVEIMAEDKPGLLYELATVFSESGCNIEVVLIDTEAHKALDVFYVTRDGGKLNDSDLGAVEERLLAVCRS